MKNILLFTLLSVMVNAQTTKPVLKATVNSAGVTGHSVTLSGCVSSTPNVQFNFYRGSAPGQESSTALNTVNGVTTPLTTCNYVDTSVVGLQTYYYVAKAYLSTATQSLSGPSNEVEAVIPGDPQPAAPTGLTSGPISGNKVPLRWNAPAPQPGVTVDGYNVFGCSEDACPDPPKIAKTTVPNFVAVCTHASKHCPYVVSANDTQNGKSVVTPKSNIYIANIQ
jgi:hypothetical protein